MIDKRRLTDVKVTYEVNTILSDLYNQIEYELRDDYNDSLEQLQSNWNSLREYIGEEWYCFDNESVEHEVAKNILDKMNELEKRNKNEFEIIEEDKKIEKCKNYNQFDDIDDYADYLRTKIDEIIDYLMENKND